MIRFLIGLTFVAIFAIAVVTYAVGFGNDNGASINLNDDQYTDSLVASEKGNLEDYKESMDSADNILQQSSIAAGDENIEGGAPFKTGPGDIVDAAGNILSSSNKRIFGDSSEFSFIFTTILAFLGAMSMYYIWKAWKGGSAD